MNYSGNSARKEIEMTTEKIYSPWIKWHGGKCPVPPDTRVEVKLRGGKLEKEYPAFGCHWRYDGDDDDGDIVEYRTVTKQADLESAEKLLRDNGYTVTKPLTFEDVTPITEAPPKGTWYWVPQPFSGAGVERFSWVDDNFDKHTLRHRMAYLDKEHALIAARHIFGLKGGEL